MLCDVVRSKNELDTPGPDGVTLRAHYEQVEKHTGKSVYEEPPIPAAGEHIWRWFIDLSASEFLTYSELRAWVEMTGNVPTPFEVEALRAMSRARQEA